MTLTVRTASDSAFDYEGTGWHVDEHGHLHIIGPPGSGNVATVHRDHWTGISKAADAK